MEMIGYSGIDGWIDRVNSKPGQISGAGVGGCLPHLCTGPTLGSNFMPSPGSRDLPNTQLSSGKKVTQDT